MAAQWLQEMQANGIWVGMPVSFELPLENKLILNRGKWEYTPVRTQAYSGIVAEIHQYQVIVNVPGKGQVRLHPDMVKAAK
jgi:hypothetical protein